MASKHYCPYCGTKAPCRRPFCRRVNNRLRQRAFATRVQRHYGQSYKAARRAGVLPLGQHRSAGVTIEPSIKRLKWQGSASTLKIFWSRPAEEWTPRTFAKATSGRIDPAAIGGAARALQHLRRRLDA